MKHESEHFNLLVEPWIPVLRTNGKPDRVGIRTALTEAGRIRRITVKGHGDSRTGRRP